MFVWLRSYNVRNFTIDRARAGSQRGPFLYYLNLPNARNIHEIPFGVFLLNFFRFSKKSMKRKSKRNSETLQGLRSDDRGFQSLKTAIWNLFRFLKIFICKESEGTRNVFVVCFGCYALYSKTPKRRKNRGAPSMADFRSFLKAESAEPL